MTEFIGIMLSALFFWGIRDNKYKIIVSLILFGLFADLAHSLGWVEYWWFNLFLIPLFSYVDTWFINFCVDFIQNGGKEDKLATYIRKNYGYKMPTDIMIEKMKLEMTCAPFHKRGFYALLISYSYYNYKYDIDQAVKFAKLAMDFVEARSTDDLILWYKWIADTKKIASRIDGK